MNWGYGDPATVHDSHHDGVDIFSESYTANNSRFGCSCMRWTIYGKIKGSELHHRSVFLHNYYTFESVHDGDHDGVVRIFVGLFCEL